MSVAQRSITSATWKIFANLINIVILFVRSVLLARWLPIEVFGVYALATSVVVLSVRVVDFGMSGAFLHRSTETENELQTAAVLFTIRLGFIIIWAVLLIGGAFLFFNSQLRVALVLITITTAIVQLTTIPSLILTRRVMQRRLAVLQLLIALVSTPIVLGLAKIGIELWTLLTLDLITAFLSVILLYVWCPVWQPRLAWTPSIVRYFFQFGSRNFLSGILYHALDRIDDIWVGFFLGEIPLGFYSRAYTFATYPRKILAGPINWVVGGAYAELRTDRPRLSQIFFNTNAMIVRSGFLLGGLLSLIVPEFIRIVLGVKWLPMLDAFRLMLVFTLFDPIKVTVASLISLGGGKPEQVAMVRLIQLLILIVGLVLLGLPLGITGVALAVDIMLVIGIIILLWKARSFVDFSPKRLFLVPSISLIIGLVLASNIAALPQVADSDWQTGLAKVTVFSISYSIILLTLERHYFLKLFSSVTSKVVRGQ